MNCLPPGVLDETRLLPPPWAVVLYRVLFRHMIPFLGTHRNCRLAGGGGDAALTRFSKATSANLDTPSWNLGEKKPLLSRFSLMYRWSGHDVSLRMPTWVNRRFIFRVRPAFIGGSCSSCDYFSRPGFSWAMTLMNLFRHMCLAWAWATSHPPFFCAIHPKATS